jgi:hypothetical protein
MKSMWKRVTVRHGAQFVKHVVPAVVKPARILWHEVIGFVFLSIGVICGFRTVHLYGDYSSAAPAESGTAFFRLAVTIPFTLMMLYFGITSFLRARKISRS